MLFIKKQKAFSSKKVKKKRSSVAVTLQLVTFTVVGVVLLPSLYLQYRLVHVVHHQQQHQHQQQQQQQQQQQSLPLHSNRRRQKINDRRPKKKDAKKPIMTAFLEPSTTLSYNTQSLHEPWFSRNTSENMLTKIEYPHIHCDSISSDRTKDTTLLPLPIDDFPTGDPFLPWIHDYFVSEDIQQVHFVAQNKRRCNTGKNHKEDMKFWEPQVALFQPIPVVMENEAPGQNSTMRIATSVEEATHPATRFQCSFFDTASKISVTSLSQYKFDYEYVTWRKLRRPMIDRTNNGKDTAMFWLSTLLFSCPIPKQIQEKLRTIQGSRNNNDKNDIFMDLVPIRTPVRTDQTLLTINHTGPLEHSTLQARMYPLKKVFGPNHILPPRHQAGRWANLPICLPQHDSSSQDRFKLKRQDSYEESKNAFYNFEEIQNNYDKTHKLVACTWTAASYTRRGDVVHVSDSAKRLREWIIFHLLVGVEHLYVYDNSNTLNSTRNRSEIFDVVQEFSRDQVTYHPWPCTICNNNRPAHSNPGERSSQYAAEASCRERYGPSSEWMTFLDIDEYLVPMKREDSSNNYDWRPILDEMTAKKIPIVQFLSSRARPRVDLMEELENQDVCKDPSSDKANEKFPNTDLCIGPRHNETFLNVFNCEYIRPPKPQRFERARKQIFRTNYVLSHFVHYATVTVDYAETYTEHQKHHPEQNYLSNSKGPSWLKRYPDYFADELTVGVLIHARSVVPQETRRRSVECKIGSNSACMVGHLCDNSVAFSDEDHQKNVFSNPNGEYCNCWQNSIVSFVLAPLLKEKVAEHISRLVAA